MYKLSKSEMIFKGISYLFVTLLSVACLFPFIYVLGVSFTSTSEFMRRSIVIIPQHWTLAAYREILGARFIYDGYKVTLFITSVGTLLNLLFTVLLAYPLSRAGLYGKAPLLLLIVFTMIFNGGMIPTYLVVMKLNLLDSVWALIVPGLVSAYNMLIMKAFFEQLPEALDEAARVEGAGELRILFSIFLPLSIPALATVGLFYAVGHWNRFFDAILYLQDASKYPLQVVLRNILMGATSLNNENVPDAANAVNPISVQMAAVMVSTLPILCVYPFIQKHFTQGVLLGSVKG